MLIYKIFRAEEWADLRDRGETPGAPIDLHDGFIHLSTADQAIGTASRHFSGASDLWLAAIETAPLEDALKWEVSRGGGLFPHLFRPLKLNEVVWARPLPLHAGDHLFPEAVSGHIDPTRPQFDRFKSLDRDRPIDMLNLVRMRSRAAYPEGHALAGGAPTGREAYAAYGRETAPILARIGARIAWRGAFEALLIGPESEHWDHVFVARYPSAHAFLEMVTDPDYRRAVIHRQAAVRSSRLIRCRPEKAGEAFG